MLSRAEVGKTVNIALSVGGYAVEPVVTRLLYDRVTSSATGPQNMMYWSSRVLVSVTHAGF